jgi:hypothetical protein
MFYSANINILNEITIHAFILLPFYRPRRSVRQSLSGMHRRRTAETQQKHECDESVNFGVHGFIFAL